MEKELTVLIVAGVLLFLRPLFSRSPTAVGVIGLTIYLLFVSQLCSWRVFKEPLVGIISYSDHIWNVLFIVSGLVLLFPIQILQVSRSSAIIIPTAKISPLLL